MLYLSCRRDIELRMAGKDKLIRLVRQYEMCNWPDGARTPSADNLLDMIQGEYVGWCNLYLRKAAYTWSCDSRQPRPFWISPQITN